VHPAKTVLFFAKGSKKGTYSKKIAPNLMLNPLTKVAKCGIIYIVKKKKIILVPTTKRVGERGQKWLL